MQHHHIEQRAKHLSQRYNYATLRNALHHAIAQGDNSERLAIKQAINLLKIKEDSK